MIEGLNSSAVDFDFEETIAKGSQSSNGDVSMGDVISDLKKRRENVLKGGINCIPWPFPRFRTDIPGIEQEQYVVLTASTKAGKTQFASFVYLYHPLDYAFEHPDQCRVHFIYFCLEESQMRIKQRYISYLLYKFDGWRLSPQDLRSTHEDYPLPQEALDLLETKKYKERLEFFDKCVQFETEDTNPTGILQVCRDYAKSVGDYKSVIKKSRSTGQNVEVFQSYTPKDPNLYNIVIIDHLGLVDTERGMNLKQSMDKVSEYAVKYLRNRFLFTVVNIQQQAMESEGLEATKQKRVIPAVATLGDTKYTARDANLILGLFDPSFFGYATHYGYTIQDPSGQGLKSYGRFLYVLRGRDGEQGGVCPLFFDGAVCQFEELPPTSDANALAQYYNRVNNLKSYRQQKKLSALILINLVKKWIKNYSSSN